jgi:hypothetical protein
MRITWDAASISLTPQQASKLLRSSKLSIGSFVLQPGEDRIVAEQLSRLLREHEA